MAHICPDCGIQLVHKVLDAIGYEECEQCAGIWVTELALKCFEDKGADELARLDDANRPARVVDHPMTRACPECKRPMQRFAFPAAPPVELDRCELCEGLWIDDGELFRMAEAIEIANRPAAPQPTRLDPDAVLAAFAMEHDRAMARNRMIGMLCKGMSIRVRGGWFHNGGRLGWF